MAQQLRLVKADDFSPVHEVQDPTRQVFQHWAFMNGHSLRRCKMGPGRRRAIDAMLALYGEVEPLMLAIEGMAADPLEGVAAGAAETMRDIEWLFGKESRLEKWMKRGDTLRARAEACHAVAAAPDAPAMTPAEMEAVRERDAQARERLRDLARRLREAQA